MTTNIAKFSIAGNDTGKETIINDGVGLLDAALTTAFALLVDNTNAVTLTEADLETIYIVKLQDGSPVPTGDITVTVEDFEKGLFVFRNETSFPATLSVTGQYYPAPTVEAGAEAYLLMQNSELRKIGDLDLNSIGKHFYVPAQQISPAATNGAAEATTETTTNAVLLPVLNYDPDTDEAASFTLSMPADWDQSDIRIKALWSSENDLPISGTFTVVWRYDTMAVSNDETLDQAPSSVYVSDLYEAPDQLHLAPISENISPSPAAGNDLISVQITREATHANDTLTGDAALHGVVVYYNVDSVSDPGEHALATLFLRAANIPQSSGDLSLWADASFYENDATEPSSGGVPPNVDATGGPDGGKVVNFDFSGSPSEFLNLEEYLPLNDAGASGAIFLVIDLDSTGPNWLFSSRDLANDGGWAFHHEEDGGGDNIITLTHDVDSFSFTIPDRSPGIIGILRDGLTYRYAYSSTVPSEVQTLSGFNPSQAAGSVIGRVEYGEANTVVNAKYSDFDIIEGKVTECEFSAYMAHLLNRYNITSILPDAPAVVAGSNVTDQAHYVEVTVQATEIGSTLTDFPVYVNLADMPAHFHSNVQSDGRDIRVTTGDGLTAIAREVVAIDTGASTGELHFKANSLSSSTNTTFRIYYNSATATEPAPDDAVGSENVWTNGYIAVYHMQEDPSVGNILDSTANGLHLTPNAMEAGDSVSGKLGQALDFDGSGEYATRADNALFSNNSSLAVQYWLNPDQVGTRVKPISKGSDVGGDTSLYEWESTQNTTGTVRFAIVRGGSAHLATSTSTVSVGVWSWIVGEWNGATLRLYFNGSEEGSANPSDGAIDDAAGPLVVAGENDGGTPADLFDGQLDEIRLLSPKAPDWYAAEYSNQNTPGTFYSVGTEQAV